MWQLTRSRVDPLEYVRKERREDWEREKKMWDKDRSFKLKKAA